MDTSFSIPAPGGGQPAAANTTMNLSPATGASIAFNNTSIDQTMFLTPAGTLATLTVSLPSNATSRLGQSVFIATTQTITALTVNGATTIINNPTTLASGAAVELRKMADNLWMQI